MTLLQAFTEWAAIPTNTALAASSRSAVNAVLMKTYGSCDVCQFTAYYTRLIFKKCNEPPNFKTKAASILVYVLEYAASREKCMRPEFDFTIASADKDPSVSGEVGQEHPSPDGAFSVPVGEATAEDPAGPPSRDGHGRFAKGRVPETKGKKWEEFMSPEGQENSRKGWKNLIEHRPEHRSDDAGRPKMAVSQLDASLKFVASYESVADAFRATGIKNIGRSIRERKMAGGHYWCRAGEEAAFKPDYLRAPKPVTQSREDGATIGKRVMQVDPMTGKVVAVHDSMEAAGRTMGCTVKNIKLAIAKGHKAMGSFWLPDGATEEQISALLSSKKDKKRRIKEFNKTKRIAVSQLDPDTLEVVATFESMKAASEALGIKSQANLHFAVSHRSMARGYYWCAAGMEKDFKPGAKRISRKPAGENTVGSQERAGAPHDRTSDPATRPPLSLFSDEELKEELRRRGWRGRVYMRMDL